MYENERDLFFEDKSNDVIQDDVFRRLSACHNVLFTGHQAFLTAEALISISETTLGNLQQVGQRRNLPERHRLTPFPFVLLSRGEHIQIIPTDPCCDTVTLAWFY